jgi:DNA-binding response OmpR family regulator
MKRIFKASILLIEGENNLRNLVSKALPDHDVTACGTALEADAMLRGHPYSLVILDLGIDQDKEFATGLIRNWREHGEKMPLIAMSQDPLRAVDALAAGADDFVRKPFRVAELQARISRHLQRYFDYKRIRSLLTQEAEDMLKAGSSYLPTADFRFGPAIVGRDLTLTVGKQKPEKLSGKLVEILNFLSKHQGGIVTKERLIEGVWGPAAGDDVNSLKSNMSTIRSTFGKCGVNFDRLVKTKARIGWEVGIVTPKGR